MDGEKAQGWVRQKLVQVEVSALTACVLSGLYGSQFNPPRGRTVIKAESRGGFDSPMR